MIKKEKNDVDFIGSQKSGNMTHNRNEGHPGFIISQMLDVSKESIKEHPNVILLFVGSNNMNKDSDADKAPADMEKTLDGLFKAEPNVTVLVSSLTTSKDEAAAKRIDKFAKDIIPVVKKVADTGKHVHLIDMTKLLDTKTDYKDGLHPNDDGFKKIADSWYKGLQEVEKRGWIMDPVPKNGTTTTKTENTKTHDESESESNKEDHSNSNKINADGSKVHTSKDEESSQNAADESDTKIEKIVTIGPNGTNKTESANTHDASNSGSEKETNETIEKIGANGTKEINIKNSEEAKAAEEEANSNRIKTSVVNPDGSTETISNSSEDSSSSSSHMTSSSEITTTISKRSAKFRLME